MDTHETTVEEFWEAFYGTEERRWSGEPNQSLVDEVSDLAPGTALDLGCGQGGDVIWLASRGWTVTGVDVSETALAVAAHAAADAGVADAIAWERHDLAASLPDGPFELVTAAYLHSPVELPRAGILRRAARTVVEGGTLLVIGHAPSPKASHPLPSLSDVVKELGLPADEWDLVRCALGEVEHAFPGEAPRTRTDTIVRYRRLPAGASTSRG